MGYAKIIMGFTARKSSEQVLKALETQLRRDGLLFIEDSDDTGATPVTIVRWGNDLTREEIAEMMEDREEVCA
jgi:hypothetical protein